MDNRDTLNKEIIKALKSALQKNQFAFNNIINWNQKNGWGIKNQQYKVFQRRLYFYYLKELLLLGIYQVSNYKIWCRKSIKIIIRTSKYKVRYGKDIECLKN